MEWFGFSFFFIREKRRVVVLKGIEKLSLSWRTKEFQLLLQLLDYYLYAYQNIYPTNIIFYRIFLIK